MKNSVQPTYWTDFNFNFFMSWKSEHNINETEISISILSFSQFYYEKLADLFICIVYRPISLRIIVLS